jgi:hypothetical protein
MIEELDIPSPPLAEQKAIAAVLGSLDDKIELNRRMNATLEAMARALFQSWFVDFDPVRAKLDGRPLSALELGYAVGHGPHLAPGEPAAERGSRKPMRHAALFLITLANAKKFVAAFAAGGARPNKLRMTKSNPAPWPT